MDMLADSAVKRALTPNEMVELEARREPVKLNVPRILEGPDLTSFVCQFSPDLKGDKPEEASEVADKSRVKEREPEIVTAEPLEPKKTEPSVPGSSFRPGTWQAPS